MKRITKNELSAIFRSGIVNGATFIGIDTLTVPTLTGGKGNPHQGRVLKMNVGSNVMVFQNKNASAYGAMVERRLKAEGKDPASFQLGERKWGVRVEGTPIIEHKGEEYLEVIFLKAGTVSYTLDHELTEKSKIIGLEAKEEGEQGGLDNKVIIRTYKMASIVRITLDKETYLIEG